ncbi:magnesium dechelatase SGRL, chloroplastic-like [Phoenix dactylifera]|uniref:Magnesium dechelatase SGRL, chloroplastic n=1 Tax=Phoenix dactylifera TaxID=42345 RepID=A0A8B9ACL5_PHODC|nr:magnesium dechelatase SGRL, chloroplastic [Phoenix dactylifera]XP_038984225.1 magnesium dechelatase SGRL, chloroplastic-like [Phoenix dactylifera]
MPYLQSTPKHHVYSKTKVGHGDWRRPQKMIEESHVKRSSSLYVSMARSSPVNTFTNNISFASNTPYSVGRRPTSAIVPGKPLMVWSCDTRDSYGSLAARILGPPTRFEASKLKVVFMGEEMRTQPLCITTRAYTLTHCDFTANLTLAVSNCISNDKLRGWQTTLQRDDVVAEWKKVKEEMSLHVHCYVSGANLLQELAAGFRYHIFSKELPLVLKAVVHGDSVLFSKHPELMEAKVWVYFHSKSTRYNRVECWGPLKNATQRTYNIRSV